MPSMLSMSAAASMALLLLAGARAEEGPPARPRPPPPPPQMSRACSLATGMTPNNHSMFKQKDFIEDILTSWGVLITGPPTPLNMLAPQGAGTGEYYQCISYDGYSFWKVAVGQSGGGGYPGSYDVEHVRPTIQRNLALIDRVTASLSSLAWHPKQIERTRRRLFGGFGGGESVGVCLPSACSSTDVKIFVGFYYCAGRGGAHRPS